MLWRQHQVHSVTSSLRRLDEQVHLPPYDFNVPNALVTNFHMSKSILLMMTAAFGGYEETMRAYSIAIKEKYRFGAYGDAMLIID